MAEKRKLICLICFTNSDLANDYCVGKVCAWWEDLEEACALKVIARLAVRMLNGSDMGEGM